MGFSYLLTIKLSTDRLSARAAVSQMLGVRLRTIAVWIAAFLIGAAIINRDGAVPFSTILIFAAASLTLGCHIIPRFMLQARLRFRSAEGATAAGRWFAAGMSAFALPSVGLAHGLGWLAFAVLGGELLTLGCATAAVALDGNGWEHLGNDEVLTFRGALPFAANSILAISYNRFDVVIMTAFSSVQQLALYAPASRIQDALYLLPGALGVVATPLIAQANRMSYPGRAVSRLVHRLIALGLAVAIPAVVVIYCLTPKIIRIGFGQDYEGAIASTRILIWFLPLAVIGAPLLSALASTGHAPDTTKVFVVAFAVAITMHLALDWRWGATGAAVASLSRDPFATLAAWLLARRAHLLSDYSQDALLRVSDTTEVI
jgi:O-antigen/teichoic acid export membrane protein